LTAPILYAIIYPLVENLSNHNSTLAEVAASFLSNLPQRDREKIQTEVHKFVRWLGLYRRVADISPADVASYGEQVSYAKLETELAGLKNQLSKVIEELKKAAADKDFRENAPLDAAREQKAHIEGRIKDLESTLKLAKIMGEYQNTPRIKIGDTVVLHDLASSEELSYALVDPREANAIKGKISVASPLGKVLLDKEKGQTVEVAAPAGTFHYRIKDIYHQ
jgi:transcription elongation factor GreA